MVFDYEASLVYGKSLIWSSIKMQHIISSIKIQYNGHQSKIASNIASEKHISKFNFALITTGYNMEKLLFMHCNKGI